MIVRSRAMAAAGHQLFLSANGVWLTDRVPVELIEFPADLSQLTRSEKRAGKELVSLRLTTARIQ
jgi:RNA:NAD 2'-phosphotransferase (TPT1/KptA family)